VTRRVFDIIEEPSGELLGRLIRALAPCATSVMMVLRDDLGTDPSANALLTRLEPTWAGAGADHGVQA
jgi:hypothetical protein